LALAKVLAISIVIMTARMVTMIAYIINAHQIVGRAEHFGDGRLDRFVPRQCCHKTEGGRYQRRERLEDLYIKFSPVFFSRHENASQGNLNSQI